MAERREIFVRDHDWIRTALMFEPRGHDIMSGVIIYPSSRDDCDFGALFIEVSGCLPMCGAGTIGLSTVVIEEGLVTPREPGRLAIETPAGRVDGRGAVFYGDKAIDRSPGGTGTSARMAQLFGKGRLKVGDTYRNESLIGTIFEGKVEASVKVGAFEGIRPSIGGWAQITGHNTIFVDDKDPLRHGFQLA
jgi:proline racemase